MRKVLIIVPTDRLGGAETNLKRIAIEMQKRGGELRVIFLSRGNHGRWRDIEPSKCTYINSPRESLGFLKALVLIFKWRLEGVKFDYSFTSHSHCNAYVGLLIRLRLLKVKKVTYRESTNQFSWHKGAKLQFFKILYKLYGKPDLIICQTGKMKIELLANVPSINEEQVKVISNPVDYYEIRELSEKKIGVDPCFDNEIVCVGRLVPQKDYPTLLRAFSKLEDNKLLLRIIGGGYELMNLKAFVKDLKLEDRVIFAGHVDNPAPFMKNAKLCVLSSKLEGYPNVLLEMMCVAKRVVATECTDGISSLPGIYTCSPEEPLQLADIINKVLVDDETRVKDNINKMREHVKNLTVKNFVDRIVEN